jgi:hypothetical protein
VPKARYNFDIFNARGVRQEQLNGTPYRYWHSYAIADVFSRRLSGTVDVLDAGGRDGGTLNLLRNLGLHGTFTCLDRQPVVRVLEDPEFEIEVVASEFDEFRPRRQFDAVLFQGCLECVSDYSEIAWLPGCLKPGGFVVATLHCRNTRRLYHVFRKNGCVYSLDEAELEPAFARIGLKIVELMPLGGVAARLCQYVMNSGFAYYPQVLLQRGAGRIFPRLRNANFIAPANRVLNPFTVWLDYALRFRRIGHCLVLEPLPPSSRAS